MKTLFLLLLAATLLTAGSPLTCIRFEIGTAKSLPWEPGTEWNAPLAGYDVKQLPKDTLALLTPETPVLVRMETLRRASLYGRSDPAAISRLLATLVERTAQEPANPLAWFDAGYLVETLYQARYWYSVQPGKEYDGASWVRKAYDLGLQNADVVRARHLILEGGRGRQLNTSAK